MAALVGKDGFLCSPNDDVLNKGGVDLGALEDTLEGASEEIRGESVLEGTLSTLRERCPESGGNDNLEVSAQIEVFRILTGTYIIRPLLEDRGLALGGSTASDLLADLLNTSCGTHFGSWLFVCVKREKGESATATKRED
jgi:hypothetical protein